MDWKEVKNDMFLFENEGDHIEGVYLGKEDVGDNGQHKIETKEGLETIWGTIVLNRMLKNVAPGTIVKIIYLGRKPTKDSKKEDYHDFKVLWSALEPMIPSEEKVVDPQE